MATAKKAPAKKAPAKKAVAKPDQASAESTAADDTKVSEATGSEQPTVLADIVVEEPQTDFEYVVVVGPSGAKTTVPTEMLEDLLASGYKRSK